MSVEGGLITESTSLTSFTRNQNKIDQDSRNDFSFVFCAAGNNTIFNKIYFFYFDFRWSQLPLFWILKLCFTNHVSSSCTTSKMTLADFAESELH